MIHGRFQPFHNGHLEYLRGAAERSDEERLHKAGYEVVVLDEGTEKQLSGAEVRAALRDGGDWERLVPPGVARVLKRLERVPV
jgi:nicotinamide mononucleotide adenylyltransferase